MIKNELKLKQTLVILRLGQYDSLNSFVFYSRKQYDDIYYEFKKDESDLNEKEDKTEYDSVKDPSTTKQPPSPCPTPNSNSKEETQVTNVNKIKKTNTHKTNNGK